MHFVWFTRVPQKTSVLKSRLRFRISAVIPATCFLYTNGKHLTVLKHSASIIIKNLAKKHTIRYILKMETRLTNHTKVNRIMANDKKLNLRQMIQVNEEIHKLSVTFPMREPVMRSAIQALDPSSGSKGLDAGCGIGLQSLLLAEEIGPVGHVTGLDFSSDNLKHARKIAQQTGFSDRISFREGDVRILPFDENAFDWAWSSDLIGYSTMDPLLLINELKRVVKPHGSVAILAWSSEKLLPGYPVLEARLSATTSGIAPFSKGRKPELHFLRSLNTYAAAGLERPVVKTFAGTLHAPLSDNDRAALVSLFEMRWVGLENELTPEEISEFNRLCRADSPEFIVDQPDYYSFFTYSMFIGQIAANL